MGSPTRKLKVRRALAKARSAKGRKNQVKIHGSTAANLPLNVPNANETAVASKS